MSQVFFWGDGDRGWGTMAFILKEQQSSWHFCQVSMKTTVKHWESLTYLADSLPLPLLYSPTHVGGISNFTSQSPYSPIYTHASEFPWWHLGWRIYYYLPFVKGISFEIDISVPPAFVFKICCFCWIKHWQGLLAHLMLSTFLFFPKYSYCFGILVIKRTTKRNQNNYAIMCMPRFPGTSYQKF